MKKPIIIFLVAALFCLCGCSAQPKVETTETQSYNQLRQVDVDDIQELTVTHEELTGALPMFKSIVKSSIIGEVECLDWERFEKIAQIREYIDGADMGEQSNATAYYITNTDTIVVCPEFFEKDGRYQTYVLSHEMMHSLLGVGRQGEESSMNLFIEGAADYLAINAMNGIVAQEHAVYVNDMIVVSFLSKLYGSEVIIEKIHNGEILDFIDEASRPGDGAKLHECMATIDYSFDADETKDAVLTELGILECINENSPVPNQELVDQLYISFGYFCE